MSRHLRRHGETAPRPRQLCDCGEPTPYSLIHGRAATAATDYVCASCGRTLEMVVLRRELVPAMDAVAALFDLAAAAGRLPYRDGARPHAAGLAAGLLADAPAWGCVG